MPRACTVSARRVGAGDVTLVALEAGAGGRPLLAVHGFTGAKEDFADLLGPLAERGWHVVAPDLRGHGSSDAPPGEERYSFEILTAEVVGVLDGLGWPRATLFGHSMGGMLSQWVALDSPERVDALVLLDTFCGPIRGVEMALVELGSAIVRHNGMAALSQAMGEWRRQSPDPGVTLEEVERIRPGHREYVEAKLLATSPDLWVALAPAFLTVPSWAERLDAISVPTAVLVGEHDRGSLDDSRRIAAAIPGAELAVVAGGGHSPQFEAPEALWQALSAFLDRLELGGRP